ncbi:hypothetical protein RRG08_044335 [Elysia crispata]|uniref:Uncharacterized protein n=1 Tax=Elysia crispata TaxID=231223 RepID=A0AAE1AA91_9GAST|nr:hypothetical protein RRG08_044335 [Elysia crispata]
MKLTRGQRAQIVKHSTYNEEPEPSDDGVRSHLLSAVLGFMQAGVCLSRAEVDSPLTLFPPPVDIKSSFPRSDPCQERKDLQVTWYLQDSSPHCENRIRCFYTAALVAGFTDRNITSWTCPILFLKTHVTCRSETTAAITYRLCFCAV